VSFTQEVKRELGAIVPAQEHCRRAELSGMLFGGGTIALGPGGHITVRLSLALPATARSALGLLKSYDVHAELRTVSSAPGGRRYEVVLGAGQRDLQLLNEVGVLSDAYRVQMGVPRRVVERHCCAVAFVRGLFLCCGSISTPGKPVHVEFTFEDRTVAEDVVRVLTRLDLPFRLAERERNVACYSKRAGTAADLLAMLGAHSARLRWEEHEVLGRVRESANRLANCDEANARRAAAAGRRQAEAARRLRADARLWRELPAAVRAAAELRLRYPYLSLHELAGRATPRLSKSSLNHRFRRLVDLAAEE
jgi:DNA-binding protein WhiA